MKPASRYRPAVPRAFSREARLLALLLFLLPAADLLAQQPRFTLKRTKRETLPVSVVLFGGYNGMSVPPEKLLDEYGRGEETVWGGFMAGMKVRAIVDTVVRPIWGGIELYYHRSAKRRLYDKPWVMYASDSSRVQADEYLGAYGIHLVGTLELARWLLLELGGGMQYLHASTAVQSDVLGLFEPVWVPTVLAGVDLALLRYDHGSINANLRAVKGFGEYGSLHFQSLLAFTFNF
jgi:hypothetical protein